MIDAQENIDDVVTDQPKTQPEAANDVELEIVEATPEQEESVTTGSPTSTPPAKAFDPKTDKVEFTTPEQQEKFNYMYKQTKMSDARNQMLTDLLQQQQKQLDELKGRNQQTDSAEAERMLISRIKHARDSGDDYAEIAATTEMVNFLADKKISERVNKIPQPVQQSPENSPEAKYVSQLMQEMDPSTGQPVRPWFNEAHPEFNNALNALEEIKLKYIGDPYALPKTLADLDQVMRARMTTQKPPQQPQTRAPSPMQGGNLTNVKQKTTIKMTRQELEIAKKLGVDPKRYAARRDEIAGRK